MTDFADIIGTGLAAVDIGAAPSTHTHTDLTLDAASTIGGVTGTTLAADHAAWTVYTPTLTNATLGNGTVAGRYLQVGKTVNFLASFTLGSTSAMGTKPALGLPVNMRATGFFSASGTAYHAATDAAFAASVTTSSASAVRAAAGGGDVTATVPFTWATGDGLTIGGSYEVA